MVREEDGDVEVGLMTFSEDVRPRALLKRSAKLCMFFLLLLVLCRVRG